MSAPSAAKPVADIRVRKSPLRAVHLGRAIMPSLIDELPVIAVLCACAEGESVIEGAEELRVKESDRIRTTAAMLAAIGGDVEEKAGRLYHPRQKVAARRQFRRLRRPPHRHERRGRAGRQRAGRRHRGCGVRRYLLPQLFRSAQFLNGGLDTMYKMAVIGKDVSKSDSAKMHTFDFHALGSACSYELLSVAKENFDEAAKKLIAEYDAFNVTIPYKLDIIPYLDRLEGDAKVFGAVNVVKDKVGYNTDGVGFMLMLENNGIAPRGKKDPRLGRGRRGPQRGEKARRRRRGRVRLRLAQGERRPPLRRVRLLYPARKGGTGRLRPHHQYHGRRHAQGRRVSRPSARTSSPAPRPPATSSTNPRKSEFLRIAESLASPSSTGRACSSTRPTTATASSSAASPRLRRQRRFLKNISEYIPNKRHLHSTMSDINAR